MKAQEFQTWILSGTLAVGVGGGLYYLLRKEIKANQVAKVQEDGLTQGSASNFAKRLQMAFDNDNYFGWGTDMQGVYQVFKEMPNKRAYFLVQAAYKTLYQKNLSEVLESELNSVEFRNVMAIYNKKKN